jgi:catechol O-methyltransferase
MECFGDSDDDDEVDKEELAIERDPSCGVCCFHSNTEASLLTHVRNSFESSAASSPSSPVADSDNRRKLRRAADVLHAIDTFCTSRHWMMHIGPEKGEILISALKVSLERKIQCTTVAPFVAVELGTYCAYASILMGKVLHETMQQQHAARAMDCHLITTEIDQGYAKIAKEIIQLSGMEDIISLHEISYNGQDTDIVETVVDAILGENKTRSNYDNEQALSNIPPMIDFLFIDHDKDAYKSDLCKLEASGMIRCGTRVVADNVLFACIDDYVQYMQQRMELGVVDTRTILSHVEYSGETDNLHDGVGECACMHHMHSSFFNVANVTQHSSF